MRCWGSECGGGRPEEKRTAPLFLHITRLLIQGPIKKETAKIYLYPPTKIPLLRPYQKISALASSSRLFAEILLRHHFLGLGKKEGWEFSPAFCVKSS